VASEWSIFILANWNGWSMAWEGGSEGRGRASSATFWRQSNTFDSRNINYGIMAVEYDWALDWRVFNSRPVGPSATPYAERMLLSYSSVSVTISVFFFRLLSVQRQILNSVLSSLRTVTPLPRLSSRTEKHCSFIIIHASNHYQKVLT